jgi:hypothetical protein
VVRLRAMLAASMLLVAASAIGAANASAHSDGCHSAHSCPSDHHTYVWYDAGGQGWSCARPGSDTYDPSRDTTTIAYGGYTYYCYAYGSAPPPAPPPADGDGDGVPDSGDGCPADANPTVDGCPEPPSDQAYELPDTRLSAVSFVRRYYRRISNRQFATAWGMLARPVRRKLGPFDRWKAGHRRSLGISVLSARARLSGGSAVVTIRLRSRDRDACGGRVVRQSFRGHWVLAPRDDSWAAVRIRIHKTSGGRVRLSKSECPPPPTRPSPRTDCQGYSPCLARGGDVDCAGGSGDGPRYVDGPVYVNGSDPYDLDRDGDGVACES